MSAVQQVFVTFRIRIWTLQSKYTFTYVCIFAPISKLLAGVNFVHVNRALEAMVHVTFFSFFFFMLIFYSASIMSMHGTG